ncbi:MAG: proline--tRNA ligase [Phycisphaerales bacterium]
MPTTEHSPITIARHGVIHNWSRTLIPTAKDAPSDAESPSHRLLARAGFIRRVTAGVYDYLPLAWRTLTKVSAIVREEMDAAGASELFMPVIVPMEFYEGTRRHEAYGDLLFKLDDRKGMKVALGPTHEETITELVKGSVSSYKSLPLNLYQIQTKFRDEARPRAGLLRCREFIMKDAYSFHVNIEGKGGLNEAYDAMYRAYTNIFTRCGLDFTAVEAESGPIGGSASHEFMVNCEAGEDTILTCPASGYAANVEKCETGARSCDLMSAPAGELQEVHTPGLPGIEQVGEFMKVKPRNMLKTIVFKVVGIEASRHQGIKWVLATVRGDHDVNEGKVKTSSGFAVELAPEKEAIAAGFAIGYVSPMSIKGRSDVLLLVDPDAAPVAEKPCFWATGSDKKDHHVKYFNWKRDVGEALLNNAGRVKVADVRNAIEGDPSPKVAGSKLVAKRGIEVGHIFKLGTKYSDAMDFRILNEKQERQSVIMGCYGIGVSRTMAACVEMSHDENGIKWPLPIAPYHVIITPMSIDPTSAAMKAACELSGAMSRAGFDVLVDDRDERPGVKFKDADLIGIPIRLTIGDKALAEGSVEFKLRADTQSKGELVKMDAVVAKCLAAAGA